MVEEQDHLSTAFQHFCRIYSPVDLPPFSPRIQEHKNLLPEVPVLTGSLPRPFYDYWKIKIWQLHSFAIIRPDVSASDLIYAVPVRLEPHIFRKGADRIRIVFFLI